MKIAMIAGYYPPDIRGGGEISTEILAQILRDEGCDVSVLTCGSEDVTEKIDGIVIKRIQSPNLYWDFSQQQSRGKKLIWHALENYNPRARARVREFLDETQADLLVTSTIENFGAEAWMAAHEAKIPSVHIMRSYYPFCFRGNAVKNDENCLGNCLDCSILSFGRRHGSNFVDGVVGISKYILDRHRQQGFFLKAKEAVIGEPISSKMFHNRVIDAQPKRFGYLGVLSADKGLASLSEAWKKTDMAGCSLSIAGEGKTEYVGQLKALFPTEVTFRGWVNSSDFLQQIDILIVPSIWHEPFGRIVIEAFAKGVPVLGSDIGGIAETVVDNRNGFRYKPGDSAELSALLSRCKTMSVEEFAAMSHSARVDADRYEARAIAKAHIAFYEEIIAHKFE